MKRLFILLAVIMTMSVMSAVVNARGGIIISEIAPNPAGGDPADQSVELSGGAPGATFDLWILSVESDCGTSQGLVDRATNIMGTFDANGFAVVMIPDLENPSNTLILTDSFTGTTSTDIDTNDDGTPDMLTDLGNILDAIGIPDSADDEACIYGADLGGSDFTFTGREPALIFRDGVTGDWYAVHDNDESVYDINATQLDPAEFDITPSSAGNFGEVNPTYNDPTAVTLSDAGTQTTSATALLLLTALLGLTTLVTVSRQD